MIAFIMVLYFFSSSWALELDSVDEEYATTFVDFIIGQIKKITQDHNELAIPGLSLSITELPQILIGNITNYQGWVGDMRTIHRVSPVLSYSSGDNLTLTTSVGFDTLRATWYKSHLDVLGVRLLGDTSLTFRQNEFVVSLTITSYADSSACTVNLHKAGFSVLSAIDVSIRPLGFFNQIRLDASVNHLSQSIVQGFSLLESFSLQDILQMLICRNPPSNWYSTPKTTTKPVLPTITTTTEIPTELSGASSPSNWYSTPKTTTKPVLPTITTATEISTETYHSSSPSNWYSSPKTTTKPVLSTITTATEISTETTDLSSPLLFLKAIGIGLNPCYQ